MILARAVTCTATCSFVLFAVEAEVNAEDREEGSVANPSFLTRR
jgi:hypothetical protein